MDLIQFILFSSLINFTQEKVEIDSDGQNQSHTFFQQLLQNSLRSTEICNCTADSTVIETILARHDKRQLPGGGNLIVTVEIWVQEVSKIIEISSEFELDIYVTEQWRDESLSFGDLSPCKQNISLDGGEIIKRLWTPSSCFINSKNASIHKSPVTNIFLMVYTNGSIMVNYRMKLVGPCEKNLKTFPIDRQQCSLTYQSFVFNHDEVELHWSPTAVAVMHDIVLPDYYLSAVTTVRRIQVKSTVIPS